MRIAIVYVLVLSLAGISGDALLAGEKAPDGWTRHALREEIAPRFWVNEAEAGQAYALGLAGRGKEAVDGRWVRTLPISANSHYTFSAKYQASKVKDPERSILARVYWLDAKGEPVTQPEYPFPTQDSTNSQVGMLVGTYKAPADSVQAKLELHLRWAPHGEVLWSDIELRKVEAPAPRKVRLASVHHRPRNSASPEINLEQFGKMVADAAAQRADIVCLPEGITVVGTSKRYFDVAEPIPGPSTRFLGEIAAKHGLYIVAGIYERDGHAVYNTSVLLDRKGQLVGKYRKVCLPREEIDGGITPGKEYPVFDTDFGRIGMMICWDLHYPEVARELAAGGAEVILLPIWGGNETLARARALENQVYLVASGYDFRTAIYDKSGEPVVIAQDDSSVIVTEVDLNERLLWPWLGDWRSRIWREGPPRGDDRVSKIRP